MISTLLFALACQSDTQLKALDDVVTPTIGYGDISGRVCDPTGYTWLEGATVFVNIYDDEGWLTEVKITTTDEDGWWSLSELPTGQAHEVMIQKGTEVIESHTVDIRAGRTTKLEEPACLDPSTLDIAVISGNYDDFDQVLDHMGITDYVVINGLDQVELEDFLLNPTAMADYDLIFFNGGTLEEGVFYDTEDASNPTVAEVQQNLRDFVTEGGSVYASDWAYDVLVQTWPDRLDFLGAEGTPNSAQLGASQAVNARVANFAMSEFLELDTDYVPVTYDLPVWPPLVQVGSTVSTHLVADIEYRENGVTLYQAASPLLVSFNGGGGRVVFSSFRMVANDNEDMVKVMKYVMFAL
jgi:hypothetical protein